MELTKDLTTEVLPGSRTSIVEKVAKEEKLKPGENQSLLCNEEYYLAEEVEEILRSRVREGCAGAEFQLGQFLFEKGDYDMARLEFEAIQNKDMRARYQLGVMCYDTLGDKENPKKGFELMMDVASSKSKHDQGLVAVAEYNIGRAYFQGYGVKQSDFDAERWWLRAANDDNRSPSIKAQTALGMYYSRPETFNMKKAFHWHSLATKAGSLESQGALGVMHLYGMGCSQDRQMALTYLRTAADRGNVYATGQLASYYYNNKLFTKAAEMAERAAHVDNVDEVARSTDCLRDFVSKGVSLGCFYFARCLQLGSGIDQNREKAATYYSLACKHDKDLSALLQQEVTLGHI
ncbi:PREDICTED: LRP2-binding protein-like [Priapulus caudatus]|uniref:LRP2-binding protein n=1 Tax=Priapulus caudatus TaxID=37621 RepID=A0ABM1E7X1_PRICU|nr:PREDICTED: LRP2-binding protein-like [Priapulus caudatus]XP_014668293.1 PREDICTED: LRP2-binding protein-like [Priapulus caudatus]XP_014668294.1 PREDICTED: LRP2-binding protein-like [Priapulus caudatus]